MAKKDDSRPRAEPASPKRLRRRLDKLESRLTVASDRRDRAQARVDALTIMAAELRASLAAAEAPTTGAAARGGAAAAAPAEPASPRPAARRSTASTRSAAKPKTRRSPSTARGATASRTTRTTTPRTTRRRRPANGSGPGGEASS